MAARGIATEGPASTDEDEAQITLEAKTIIRQNVLWAMGGGLLPFPVLDVVAITAAELKMLKELSALYGVPFREEQAKSILASLFTGLGAPFVGAAVATSLAKAIPAAGYFGSLLAVPAFAGAFTYAVGKVFHLHFAFGGTFLNFNPRKVREHFAREFEEGKLVASKVKSESHTS